MRFARILIVCAAVALARPAAAQSSAHLAGITFGAGWDSAPHALSTARDFETLYTLYGAGIDTLLGAVDLTDGKKGILARLAKVPLDTYVAWLTALGSHELGHCQAAWLAGSRDCHWISAPGPYALGHIITVDDAGRLTAAGRMSVTAGGVQATLTAADALKRDMFANGGGDWTRAPLLALRQWDFTLYGLTAPSPAGAKPEDYANDMTNYAIRYGSRSGRGGEAVHRDIVHGALWNLFDPMTLAGVYTYFGDYVFRGDSRAHIMGVHAAGRSWAVTTNAWLSEVGVRYALGVFTRDGDNNVFELTPSWGEGQPAIDGRWSYPLDVRLRLMVSADLWRQRATAASGPLQTGGAAGGGLSYRVGQASISGNVGYKTRGAMLGQPFEAGWYYAIAVTIRAVR